MKIRCWCDELIRDQTDALPHKAWFHADEDREELDLAEKDIIQAGPGTWTYYRTSEFFRPMYQCPACGRLYVEGRGRLWTFEPRDDDVPHDLLQSKEPETIDWAEWQDLRSPEHAELRERVRRELSTELGLGHALSGRDLELLALHDGIHLVVRTAPRRAAVVRLTWSGHVEQTPLPETRDHWSVTGAVLSIWDKTL